MKAQKFICILSAVFLLIACSKGDSEKGNSTETVLQEKAQLQATPQNLITLEKAKDQLENYNNAHQLELGGEYALRTWISLEDLKAYIAFIEEESKKKGIAVNGIDIIHTQYKEAAPGSGNPGNSVYEKTLMFAPTYQKGNSNIAFDPLYSEQGKPKDLQVLLKEIKNDSIAAKDNEDGKISSIANNMSSCPNHCP